MAGRMSYNVGRWETDNLVVERDKGVVEVLKPVTLLYSKDIQMFGPRCL